MQADSKIPVERLVELLARHWTSLEQIRALSEKQDPLIEAGQISELLKVLAEKSRRISELQEAHTELAPALADADLVRWNSPEQRAEVQAFWGQCQNVWKQLLERDAKSQERLRVLCDQTVEQLKMTRTASQAHSAYAGNHLSHARRLDLSSEG